MQCSYQRMGNPNKPRPLCLMVDGAGLVAEYCAFGFRAAAHQGNRPMVHAGKTGVLDDRAGQRHTCPVELIG